jgi:exonuclease SbcC
MILSRFLKPKWQHADPATRQQAVQGLENTDPTLSELARQDPDPSVRRAALERLGDLDLLQCLAREDADADVQAAAIARYRALLAGQTTGPTLTERLERLQHNLDADLVDYLLRHAAEPELRLAALEHVGAEPALAEIAQRDSHPEVRLAALERVHNPELLDQIARQSRNRDKRLYRRARERLDALNAEQTGAAHRERLCAEMEHLQWDGESGINAARFPKLEQEWRDQESAASPELCERYAQARTGFLANRQASAGRRSQRLELVAALETLLERLRHETEPSAELNAAIQYATHEAPAAWAQFGPAQDAEIRRLEERFQQQMHDIHERERILQRSHARAERLRELLQQAETLLQQPSEVHDAELKQLRHRWDGLERPESESLAHELQTGFDSLLDRLRTRLHRQIQQRDQEWQELQDVVRQLEVAAEEGELQHATEFQEQARHRLKHNIGLSRAQMAAIEERLQACAGRLGELRDWRRWGAHQAREQLCATAESLIGLDAEPPEIAQRIQQARDAWKALDHHEGAAPKALWKRFNHACEQAYAPCQAFFEAQNRERRQNLEKKQAICDQLEQFETATDWKQVDWREADRLRRRAQEQWYKSGPVNRTDRKTLDRRFQHILKRLDEHLGAERAHELQRRQQLIQQVQALADHSDLRAAIEIAKKAQAEWHPTVQASPRQEQVLWKEFRTACDAVFARRHAEQEAIDAERQGHLQRKRELCAEIEALAATTDPEQLTQARARLHAAQQEWEATGPAPKTDQRSLDQRFETAMRRLDQQEQTLRRNRVRDAFANLHRRARLCAQLETLLVAAPAADAAALIAQAQETWLALPTASMAQLEPIQQRFDTVVQALSDADNTDPARELRTRLEQNLERKRIDCVSMEIIAGVESPPDCAQLRMEYQVARLSASLTGAAAKTDRLHDPRALRESWCLTGALPAEDEAALDTRFLHALYIWWRREET